ncbi:tripartite tricarboxylate transporter TctB family protein [Cardiobacterium valvarum]|uniref:DUF1468 domain-containing protein n=1 Tax=Cardiobacterium valvarum F0432 TaxID=797473 RepID=G9ZGC4_9GAMM|nr:tripartite tricarboxylate transporter TctB family protein [Cardiobacterium valvarum]EHM53300.1 hypothetical protein HMPREF9080_01827 [Cardiobacterium valvarum F0432]
MNTPAIRESRADLYISIGMLVFCVFAAIATAQLKTPPGGSIAGPAFMPWIMVVLLGLGSAGLLVRALWQEKTGDSGSIALPGRRVLRQMVLFVLLMIAYAVTLMPVGYIWTTAATLLLGLLILGERKPLVLILFPAVMTAAVYLGFTKLLAVWLP